MSAVLGMPGNLGERPRWLADDAVCAEPVWAVKFPIFGKIIGNFSKMSLVWRGWALDQQANSVT
jgi:hypothetical protein